MTKHIYLNVGCGKIKLPGFINIDLESGGDIQCDITKGFPFSDSTIDGIYSEHFIERLAQKDLLIFLRECRRVLKPGGRVRIATPDLAEIVSHYSKNKWHQFWLKNYGYEWIKNRSEYLNVSLRECGNSWVVDEEELNRLTVWAGFLISQHVQINQSTDSVLAGLETRFESTLIMEYTKSIFVIEDNPLVSIIIPAYRADFLAACLDSAVNQTHSNIEILVLDDCPSSDVEKIVKEFTQRDRRIIYHRNAQSLGEPDNLTRGIHLATGEFIKPLYDDDLLIPDAIEKLLNIWRAYPNARLAAGQRLTIDADNKVLHNIIAAALSPKDTCFNGLDVLGFLLSTRVNSLGEPTCMMFRKQDALTINEINVMTLFGRLCLGIGDVCLAVHLLSRGDLVYVSDPIAYFRIHSMQTCQQPKNYEQGIASWAYLREQATRLGISADGYAINYKLIEQRNNYKNIDNIKPVITLDKSACCWPPFTSKISWIIEDGLHSELQSSSLQCPIGMKRKKIKFSFPVGTKKTLRFYPSDKSGFLYLYGIQLVGESNILWSWDKNIETFLQKSSHGIFPVPLKDGDRGAILSPFGCDQWLELPVSAEILSQADYMEIEMSWPMSIDYFAVQDAWEYFLKQNMALSQEVIHKEEALNKEAASNLELINKQTELRLEMKNMQEQLSLEMKNKESALNLELASKDAELTSVMLLIDKKNKEIDSILHSRSWRITKPLRMLIKAIRVYISKD